MNGNHVARVIELVEKFYRPVGKVFAGGKQYGCLALRGPLMTKTPLVATIPFGVIPDGSGCYELAMEKVRRLAGRPGDWSSYQSRDLETLPKRYGGAIRLPDTGSNIIGYMGWSSYPEKVDEAFKLVISVEARLMEVPRAEFIANFSKNEFLPPMFDLFSGNR